MSTPDNSTLLEPAPIGGRVDVDALRDLAREVADVDSYEVGAKEYLVGHGPDGPTVIEVLDREPTYDQPLQVAGDVRLDEPESLVAYVLRHGDNDHTTLWLNRGGPELVAVIDDHAPAIDGYAGWAQHRAAVKLRRSPELQAWASRNGQGMTQEEFADHLDEYRHHVVDPTAGDLVTIARTFSATTSATFVREVDRASGDTHLVWREETDAQAGRDTGRMDVPDTFTLRIPLLVGDEPVDLTGRFLYRVRGGQLALSYKLVGLEELIRERLDALAENVAVSIRTADAALDDVPLFFGQPPSCRRTT